jgi:hypothetical protein
VVARHLGVGTYEQVIWLSRLLARKCYTLWNAWPLALRYLRLRAAGYRSVNFGWRDYGWQTHSKLCQVVREIFDRANLPHFDVILEHGCGTRRRTTPGLREFAGEIWGTDLFSADEVQGGDRYFKIDINRLDRLHELPDHAVDAILIINYIGMHPHTTWHAYFSEHNERLAPYMESVNFPRVLRSRGYLICCEWEAEPEARWGKSTLDEINRRSNEKYLPPPLPNYELIACGFSTKGLCPFVVYRRT